MTNIFNSRIQYQKTEENIQLAYLEEMGRIYIENSIAVSSNEAKKLTLTWLESPPTPPPDITATFSKYLFFLNTEIEKFFPGKQKTIELKANSFKFYINISVDELNKKIVYNITPSVDGNFNNKNTKNGVISLNLDIRE
jgi:hypothetical protein